jgi:hypothetical protein
VPSAMVSCLSAELLALEVASTSSQRSRASSSRASSSSSSAETEQPSWSLVWCNERCHKSDADAFRLEITEHVEKAGGELLRFKKALGFEKWLLELPQKPSVLLADWREAKPCLEIVADSVVKPCSMLVYTINDKQFKMATRWHATLPSEVRNNVHVMPTTYCAEAIVQFATLSMQPHRESLNPPPQFNIKLSVLLEESCDQELGAGKTSAKASVPPIDMIPVLATGPGCSFTPASTPFISSRSATWEKPVAEVVASFVASASPAEVNRMLVSAMPTRYED